MDAEEEWNWSACLPDEVWAKYSSRKDVRRIVDEHSNISHALEMANQFGEIVVHEKDRLPRHHPSLNLFNESVGVFRGAFCPRLIHC